MLTSREQALALIGNEPLFAADVIVLLQGDGLARVPMTVALYNAGVAKHIVVSGGAVGEHLGSFSPQQICDALVAAKIPANIITLEDQSKNTHEQAVHMFALAKKNTWKHMMLVASAYHQYRAFLTFLKQYNETKASCDISMAAALPNWFTEERWGTRLELLEGELTKVEEYKKLGHIAAYEEAVTYLQAKAERFNGQKPIIC
jgi:uncharacterized SAM-binding protein YcdF (DUF218 family)